MKHYLWGMILITLCALPAAAQDWEQVQKPRKTVRFVMVDVIVDSGNKTLAAYQIEVTDPTGRAKIVGIEGGTHPAFAKRPPYYDAAALNKGRVIVAAYTTAKKLPSGKTRVARLHMQITGDGDIDYTLKLHTAASAKGEKIAATVTTETPEREGKEQ
jgi:hypothetical protein